MIPRKRIFKTKSLYPKRTVYIHKGRFRLFKHRTERQRLFRRFNTYILPTGSGRSYNPAPTKSFDKPRKRSFRSPKKDWSAEKSKFDKMWKSPKYKSFYTPKQRVDKNAFEREKKKVRQPKVAKKTFKKVENRGGKRDYVWAGKWYGEMKPLGPKLIFEVFPTQDFRLYSKLRKKFDDHRTVLVNTKAAMQKVLDGLKIYAKVIINRYVPKETGDLRKAMLESINNSKVHNLRMKVSLDTGDIDYANPVNNMPQKKIRHKAWMKQIGRRSGKILVDPKASPGWFDTISMLLNTRAKTLLALMIDDIVMAWIYRQRPSGWVHPPVGTKIIKIESEAHYTNRMKAYEARGNEYKRIGKMRRRGSVKITKEIPVRRNEEKAISVRSGDKAKTVAEMRERKYKAEHKWIQQKDGTFRKKRSLVVEYPRWLIKDFFKIRGLNKK